MVAVIELSVSDWIEVKDNPRQRDTERRAAYGLRNHLARYSKVHDWVFAASKNNQILCKLDGHTRAYLWASGDLAHPPDGKVKVILIGVASLVEAKELYEQLDSPSALKRPHDFVFGATRDQRFKLKSSLLSGCRFGTYLKLADCWVFRGDINQLVKNWKSELLLLDSMNLPKKHPPLITAALLAIRRDGIETCRSFWEGVYSNSGTKTSQGSDGIDLLCRHLDVRKANGSLAGYENVKAIIATAWTAYEAWLDGRRGKVLRQSNMTEVVMNINNSTGDSACQSSTR